MKWFCILVAYIIWKWFYEKHFKKLYENTFSNNDVFRERDKHFCFLTSKTNSCRVWFNKYSEAFRKLFKRYKRNTQIHCVVQLFLKHFDEWQTLSQYTDTQNIPLKLIIPSRHMNHLCQCLKVYIYLYFTFSPAIWYDSLPKHPCLTQVELRSNQPKGNKNRIINSR